MEKGEKTATHPHTNKRANSTIQQQTTFKQRRILFRFQTKEQMNRRANSQTGGQSSTDTSTHDFREYGNTEKKL